MQHIKLITATFLATLELKLLTTATRFRDLLRWNLQVSPYSRNSLGMAESIK